MSPDLERTLVRYLTLQIEALERSQTEIAERQFRDQVRSDVARMVTRLCLLAIYGAILGAVSAPLLLAALVDPSGLVRSERLALAAANGVVSVVPESLRATLVAAASTFVLFLFGAASRRAVSDLGGILFVGVTLLSVLAFAATAASGLVGALAALPGLAAAVYLLYRFLALLRRLDAEAAVRAATPPAVAPTGGPGALMNQYLLGFRRLSAWIHPTRGWWLKVIFTAVPCLAVVAVIAVAAYSGAANATGGAFLTSWLAQRVAATWCLWAVVVTPGSVRIPLWSTAAWAALLLTVVVQFDAVSVIFALAAVGLLFTNLVLVVLAWP